MEGVVMGGVQHLDMGHHADRRGTVSGSEGVGGAQYVKACERHKD